MNKKIIIAIAILLAIVLVLIVVSGFGLGRKGDNETVDKEDIISTLPVPKSYKNNTVSQSLVSDAVQKYQNKGVTDMQVYTSMIGYVERYYMYKDVLAENNIPVPPMSDQTYEDIERNVGVLHKIVLDNLVSHADFAYVKVRFALFPSSDIEEDVLKQVPNPREKANQLIERYRSKFLGNIVNVQQIINESNTDQEMTMLNQTDVNEYVTNYTSDQNLFFTDPGFNAFLFAQKRSTVSPVYELKHDSKPYAYLIVFPTNVTLNKFNSIDDIVKEKKSNFSYK